MSESMPGRPVSGRRYQRETEARLEIHRRTLRRTRGFAALRRRDSVITTQRCFLLFRPLYNKAGQAGDPPHPARDVTGEFGPMACNFAATHNIPADNIFIIDNGDEDSRDPPGGVSHRERARQVEHVLDDWNGAMIRCFVFFCHGSWNWIQLGFWTPPRGGQRTTEHLAGKIQPVAKRDGRISVVLFCCLTGSNSEEGNWVTRRTRVVPPEARRNGVDSFAFQLRDALISAGVSRVWVDAHTTVGPSVENPWVRRFSEPSGSHGQWLVTPPNPGNGTLSYYGEGSMDEGQRELFEEWSRKLSDPHHSMLLYMYWHLGQRDIHHYLEVTR